MEQSRDIPKDIYDVVIIGAGPAGLTAGLYAARGRMNVLLLESLTVVGQATTTEMIENYPGIEKTTGPEFIDALKKQVKTFGLECRQGTVKSVSRGKGTDVPTWRVEDENGAHEALSVIIASGAHPRKLEVPGEEELFGKGVSYCATCDGAFFRDKDIVVIGGGDTAVEEALFLTRFAKKVTLIHRRDRLRAAKVLQERAFSNKKMGFVWNSVVEDINGAEKVEKIGVKDIKTDKKADIACDGVFVYVGWHPNTDFVKGLVDLGEKGRIIIDSEMKTSQEGIFAAGDCCKKHLHQIVTACGDGAVAAFSAQRHAEELKGTAYK